MSSDFFHSSSSAWEALEQGTFSEKDIGVPTIRAIQTKEGFVRYLRDSKNNLKVLLPIAMDERQIRLPESGSIKISDSIYIVSGNKVRHLCVVCLYKELNGVFAELCDELIKRVSEGQSIIESLNGTVNDFRVLLASADNAVSENEIIGLAGELIVLHKLIKRNKDAIKVWRGPEGDRHDFRLAGLSLEVKTTTRLSHHQIHISSDDQLEPPSGGSLFLAHIVIEKAADGKVSIAELFDRICNHSANISQFRELINRLGCSDPYSAVWNRIKFNFEKIDFYTISENFPSIRPSAFLHGTIPPGIHAIQYVIDLEHAKDCKLSSVEGEQLMDKLSGC